MSHNIVRSQHAGAMHWGVVRQQRVVRLQGNWPTTHAFVSQLDRAHLAEARELAAQAPAGSERVLALEDVELLSPVTSHQQFICQGANHRSHMRESGMDPGKKSFNMILRKASSAIVPASSDVVRPIHVRLLDYEVGLGLVLGQDIHEPCQGMQRNCIVEASQ